MSIALQNGFLKGVIEGFYGRPWRYETRLAYATYLPQLGLDSYLYCPKADRFLRKCWHQPWPADQIKQLAALSETYSNRGLQFGVGLSPFALYEHYGAKQRALLQRKVEEINTLDAPLLAVLFDDMPGELADLAGRQAEIVGDVQTWTTARRLVVCPTYYSFDPVLEKYFGAMPANYWQQLGAELADNIDIFWTGNKVCSDAVSVADIQTIQGQLGRPVVLWDNYPVNDGAQRSNFLYGRKLQDRDPGLGAVLQGHLCNPMNQGLVSLLALQGLAELYGDPELDGGLVRALWGAPAYDQFLGDLDNFQHVGLSGLGVTRCNELATLYEKLPGAAAREVAGWLRGEYTFDPACLTD